MTRTNKKSCVCVENVDTMDYYQPTISIYLYIDWSDVAEVENQSEPVFSGSAEMSIPTMLISAKEVLFLWWLLC